MKTTINFVQNGSILAGTFTTKAPVQKLTPAMIQQLAKEYENNRIKVNFEVSLDELIDGCLEGLNDIFEDVVDSPLIQDIEYKAIACRDNNVIIEGDCDVSEILDQLYDYYFMVSPEVSGEAVWHLVGQNKKPFGGWSKDGPVIGGIVATENSFDKISKHAADYSLDKVPIVFS